MKNTCAVFITDKRKVIVCHPTNSRAMQSWSLPKGICEENETQAHAAAREVFEEIGYKVDEKKLVKMGDFEYLKDKYYTLFLYEVQELPDVKSLKCASYIPDTNQPEVDQIQLIDVCSKVFKMFLNPRQFKIVDSVFGDK